VLIAHHSILGWIADDRISQNPSVFLFSVSDVVSFDFQHLFPNPSISIIFIFQRIAAMRTRFGPAHLLPLPVLETGANYELTEKEEPPTATAHTGAETGRFGAELGPRISGQVRAGAGSPTVPPPAVGRSVPEGA
jgi:hypothetical protein